MHMLVRQVWPPGWRITVEVLVNNQPAYAFGKAIGFQDYAITLEMIWSGDCTEHWLFLHDISERCFLFRCCRNPYLSDEGMRGQTYARSPAVK
jgi:hypothetical protein